MNKAVKVILALVLVGAIVATALIFGGKSSDDDTNNGNKNDTSGTATSSATITYDGSSFSPEEVSIKSGGTVTFVNDSDTEVQPSSDNHPTHTVNPEINFGTIEPGESKTMTVDTKGEFGFHNHLSASQTGVINVE